MTGVPRGSLTNSPRRRSAKANGRPSGGREDEIIAAAVEIFHANGYAATSVDDVANLVGILKGSLYYYIDSKEDLLARIVEDVHKEVEELTERTIVNAEGPALERISNYVRALVEYNARNIKRVRVYYHDYEQLSAERLATVRSRRRANEQTIIGALKEAKDAGELPAELNERLAARTVFATILWMYTWYKPGGGTSGKELGEFCANFVVSGLRGAAARGPEAARPRRRAAERSA